MHSKQNKGFSLIELMIVVAVITLLASIAYPSYQDHVRKARRSAAQQFMLDIANKQEQYMLDARQYASDTGTLNLTTPDTVSSFYTFAISDTPDAYTITATPTASNAGASTLTLNSLGVKTPADEWK